MTPLPSRRHHARPSARPAGFRVVSLSTRTRPFLLLLTFTFTSFASAQTPARISGDAPIINWRLPSFTPEGYRESLIRGAEARLLPKGDVELKELTLTLFTGDESNRIETILLSPTARVRPAESIVTSEGRIRVINDQFEATATGWRYEHKTKKVSLAKDVRVVFPVELKNLLQ